MGAPAIRSPVERHPLEIELKDLISSDEQMWEFLQQGSLDGVWYWNLEQPDQEWMSPELWQLFGVDPATKAHDPAEWQDIIFQEDLAVALENFQRHCEDPSHPYDQVVRYRHADGSTVWVRCRGVAIRDETGKPIRMLGAHNDLTAAKRAEEEALREKTKLEVANEELRDFVYGVSHDLKAPSRTAKQLIEETLYAGENLTADQTELLENASETLSRMQSLVDHLLEYGRIVEQQMQWDEVDLNAVLDETTNDLYREIEAAGATLEVDPLPCACGHPVQLRMLLSNLISNALKYRQPDVAPHIHVTSVEHPHERFDLLVRDNGLGIEPEFQERIFGIFTRLHRNDEVPGSGLGLALCKRIAANQHGTIGVQSTPGAGSTFTVNLLSSQ